MVSVSRMASRRGKMISWIDATSKMLEKLTDSAVSASGGSLLSSCYGFIQNLLKGRGY